MMPWRFLLICAVGGAVALALTAWALRRQARRNPPVTVESFIAAWRQRLDALPTSEVPAVEPPAVVAGSDLESDRSWWWAVGALSDIRRRVRAGAALTDPIAEPLLGPAACDALLGEWPTIRKRLTSLAPSGPWGWAPPSGHTVELPTLALQYDRYEATGAPA